MPMFSTSVKRSPVAPSSSPPSTEAQNARIRSSTAWTSAEASSPPAARNPAARGALSAMCSTARRSVAFTASPAAMAARLPSRSAARARSSSAARTASVMAVLDRSSSSPSARREKRSNRAGSAANRGRMASGALPSARASRARVVMASQASFRCSAMPSSLPRSARRPAL